MGKREACEGDMWTRTESVLNSKSGRTIGGARKETPGLQSTRHLDNEYVGISP